MFKQYAWEIYQIARENHVDRFIAADMFLANVRNAGEEGLPCYPGAGDLPYAALRERWEALTEDGRQAARKAYTDAVRTRGARLSEAWRAGDREAFAQAVMEA